MKRNWVIFFSALLLNTTAWGQWVSQWVFTTGDLKCVSYFNANHLFIGWPGYTDKTTDGGATWQNLQVRDMINQPYSATTLYDHHFISPTRGVASGAVLMANSYAILLTTNGGSNWSVEWTSNAGAYPRVLNKFCFTSPSDGYAVGTNGMIVRTLDGGDNWAPLTSGTLAELFCIDFPTSLVGYVGASGGILKTTNAGGSWAMTPMPGVTIREIWFHSSDTGYAAGHTATAAGVFLKTTDGGATWNTVPNPFSGIPGALTGTGYDTLYMGSGNRLCYTTNGGQWWNYFPNMPGVYNDIEFLGNSDSAYVVGNLGACYKTGNGGGTVLAPVAMCTASTPTTICINNTVSFTNYGNPAWTYTWLLDNVAVASTYNATINFNTSGSHQVKLIANNGLYADTSAQISVTVNGPPNVNAIALSSSSYTICPGQGVILQVPNTQSGVSYQVLLNGITPVGSPQNGNGGTRSFNVNGITSTSNYQVSGTATNGCGTTVVYSGTVTITVDAVNQGLSVDALNDTVCSGTPDTIALYSSVPGVSYRLRIGNTPVSPPQTGNGGTLYFPTGNLTSSVTYNILGTNSTNCSAQMVMTASVTVIYVQAVIGNPFSFVNTNDTIQLQNNSTANNYLWTFGPNANPLASTDTNPSVFFTTAGTHTIYLDAMGANGCVSHDTLSFQAVDFPAAGTGALCAGENHERRYSNGNTGYVILDYCADINGYTYATGYYDSSWNNTQYNLLIMKFDPSGQLVWQHKQHPFSYGFNAYVSSFGNAITVDSLGNFYVAGSFASTSFAIGSMAFSPTSYNNVLRGFVVKFSPAGVPQWKIEGYSTVAGGATAGITDIVCKKNNELYLSFVSSAYVNYYFTNTTLSGPNGCIGVAKINASGQLLGHVTASGASACGVQMFYNPNLSSYNTNRVAYVGPRLALSGDTLYLGTMTTSGTTFGAYTVPAAGNLTGLIAKLNTSTMVWTGAYRTFYTSVGTQMNGRFCVPVFTVDYMGNVYWAWQTPTQTFSQTATIGSTVVSGQQFSFLAKYKPNGTPEWVLPDNSPVVVVSLAPASGGQIVGYGQSPDPYITNSDFPLLTSINGGLYGFPSEGYREGFLFGYSNTGNLTWTQRIHGPGNENSMVMTAKCDQLYFIGSSDSLSVLGNDTIATGYNNLFVGKYSAGGNCTAPACGNPFFAQVAANDSTLCPGACAVITVNAPLANGNITYNWTPGNMTTQAVSVCPSTTTAYTCIITDANGYADTVAQNIIVLSAPVVSVSGDTAICQGGSSTFTANGGSTYLWMPGNLSANPATLTPSSTTTYTVVGTDANGCADTSGFTLTVNPLPFVAVDLSTVDTLCISTSVITLTGGTPAGGTFTGPGVSGDSLFNPAVAGAGVHGITYLFTDSTGCSATAIDSILVDLCLGTDQPVNESGVSCFPNPASSIMNIQLSTDLIGSTMYILDARGGVIQVSEINVTQISLNIARLESGLYCIRITGQDAVTRQVFFSKI